MAAAQQRTSSEWPHDLETRLTTSRKELVRSVLREPILYKSAWSNVMLELESSTNHSRALRMALWPFSIVHTIHQFLGTVLAVSHDLKATLQNSIESMLLESLRMRDKSLLSPKSLSHLRELDCMFEISWICIVALSLKDVALSTGGVAQEENGFDVLSWAFGVEQIDVFAARCANGCCTYCGCLLRRNTVQHQSEA